MDPEQTKALEARVKALEEYKQQADWSVRILKFLFHGVTVATIVLSVVACSRYAILQWLAIDQHEKKIEELIKQNEAKALAKDLLDLRAEMKEIDSRLRGWENRGFKLIQSVPIVGQIVAVASDRLTVEFEDRGKKVQKVFHVAETTIVHRAGAPFKFSEANLTPKTQIRFMSLRDPDVIDVMDVLP